MSWVWLFEREIKKLSILFIIAALAVFLDSLGISMYRLTLLVNIGHFAYFPIWIPFIFFFFFLLSRTSNTTLNRAN